MEATANHEPLDVRWLREMEFEVSASRLNEKILLVSPVMRAPTNEALALGVSEFVTHGFAKPGIPGFPNSSG